MRIKVTEADIKGAGTDVLSNPLTRALRRVTGHNWIVFLCNKAMEMTAPFRSVMLPPTAVRFCDEHRRTRKMQPFEFELDIPPQS